jgi:hypothetical protein
MQLGKKSLQVFVTFLSLLMGIVIFWHNAVFLTGVTETGFLLTKAEAAKESIYLPAFYIHIATGSFVLVAGVAQFIGYIRRNYSRIHKFVGRFYTTVIIFLTAPSGFIMGFYANGGLVAQMGFVALAICWWYFTVMGWRKAIQKNWAAHRAFMLRSYGLTFAAVMLRLYSFLFALAGYRGESIYNLIVWLSWFPTLILIELWLRRFDWKPTVESFEGVN